MIQFSYMMLKLYNLDFTDVYNGIWSSFNILFFTTPKTNGVILIRFVVSNESYTRGRAETCVAKKTLHCNTCFLRRLCRVRKRILAVHFSTK